MSSTNQEITIKFNNRVLDGYYIEYPRFVIAINLEEHIDEDDYEYITYFLPTEKDMLIDYINNDLLVDIESYGNEIKKVDILWVQAEYEDYPSCIDTIYMREN